MNSYQQSKDSFHSWLESFQESSAIPGDKVSENGKILSLFDEENEECIDSDDEFSFIEDKMKALKDKTDPAFTVKINPESQNTSEVSVEVFSQTPEIPKAQIAKAVFNKDNEDVQIDDFARMMAEFQGFSTIKESKDDKDKIEMQEKSTKRRDSSCSGDSEYNTPPPDHNSPAPEEKPPLTIKDALAVTDEPKPKVDVVTSHEVEESHDKEPESITKGIEESGTQSEITNQEGELPRHENEANNNQPTDEDSAVQINGDDKDDAVINIVVTKCTEVSQKNNSDEEKVRLSVVTDDRSNIDDDKDVAALIDLSEAPVEKEPSPTVRADAESVPDLRPEDNVQVADIGTGQSTDATTSNGTSVGTDDGTTALPNQGASVGSGEGSAVCTDPGNSVGSGPGTIVSSGLGTSDGQGYGNTVDNEDIWVQRTSPSIVTYIGSDSSTNPKTNAEEMLNKDTQNALAALKIYSNDNGVDSTQGKQTHEPRIGIDDSGEYSTSARSESPPVYTEFIPMDENGEFFEEQNLNSIITLPEECKELEKELQNPKSSAKSNRVSPVLVISAGEGHKDLRLKAKSGEPVGKPETMFLLWQIPPSRSQGKDLSLGIDAL